MIRLTKDGNKVQNKNNNSNGAIDNNRKNSNNNSFMKKQGSFGKSNISTVRQKKGS